MEFERVYIHLVEGNRFVSVAQSVSSTVALLARPQRGGGAQESISKFLCVRVLPAQGGSLRLNESGRENGCDAMQHRASWPRARATFEWHGAFDRVHETCRSS
jgi:hypothetical protein